jgi:hypothetical protein
MAKQNTKWYHTYIILKTISLNISYITII